MKYLLLFFFLSFNVHAGLKVLTYNLALDGRRVEFAKTRLGFINDFLYHSGADVLCLQEVWGKKNKDYLKQNLSDRYLYSFSSAPTQSYFSEAPTCGLSVIFGEENISSCLYDFCLLKNKRDLGSCFKKNCSSLIKPLIEENRSCAEALLSSNQELNILSFLKLINPFKGAPRLSFQGDDGLLILSKKEIVSKSLVDLTNYSTFYKRSALSVIVDNIKIYCTQLNGDLEYFMPYMGPLQSWSEENAKQGSALLEALDQTRGPTIVAGNFNCSLEHKESFISPYNPELCESIQKAGFKDHLFETKPECTYCASNNLISENRQDSFLLDHIFSKELKVLDSEVVMKKRVQFESMKSQTQESQLSTNHGVLIEVEK